MQKPKPNSPENHYEILEKYLTQDGTPVTVYSVPLKFQRMELQHTRPKGVPMLTPGCSWVVVPGGM